MLTKAAIMHKDYLIEYQKVIPSSMLKYIDEKRNCEDLAMAFVIAWKVVNIIVIYIMYTYYMRISIN